MFHVGQHVVCVDAEGASELSVGIVYTITGCGQALPNAIDACGRRAYWWVVLAEVLATGGYTSFSGSRFRPLSSTRLDAFRQLLVSPNERVGA